MKDDILDKLAQEFIQVLINFDLCTELKTQTIPNTCWLRGKGEGEKGQEKPLTLTI